MFVADLGDGAHLRLWEHRDAEALHEVIAANRDALSVWMPWAREQTLDATREYLTATRRQWADGLAVEAAIVADGAIVGGAGLNRVGHVHRAGNVGYWLAASAQGRGLVTRATAALLDHGFDDVGLHRVELRAGTGNVRSRAVAERLGFTREGVLRDAEWVNDRWIDHVVHSMLAPEWAQRRAPGPDDHGGSHDTVAR